VYSFGVSANATSKEIYDASKELEDKLKGIEGVSEIIITGKPEEKISVYLDYDKINKFGINITQVYGVL
jgi:multidrug efflux pump subunit AcrB